LKNAIVLFLGAGFLPTACFGGTQSSSSSLSSNALFFAAAGFLGRVPRGLASCFGGGGLALAPPTEGSALAGPFFFGGSSESELSPNALFFGGALTGGIVFGSAFLGGAGSSCLGSGLAGVYGFKTGVGAVALGASSSLSSSFYFVAVRVALFFLVTVGLVVAASTFKNAFGDIVDTFLSSAAGCHSS